LTSICRYIDTQIHSDTGILGCKDTYKPDGNSNGNIDDDDNEVGRLWNMAMHSDEELERNRGVHEKTSVNNALQPGPSTNQDLKLETREIDTPK